MSERTKKIVFTIGFVIVSIAMGYMVYRILFPQAPREVAQQPTEEQIATGNLPSAGVGRPSTGTGAGLANGEGQLPALPPLPNLPPETGEQNDNPRNKLVSGSSQSLVPSNDRNGARFYNGDDGRFYRVNPDGSTTALGDKQFFNVKNVDWGKKSDQAILEFPDGSNLYYDFVNKKQVQLPTHWENFDFSPNDDRIVGKSMGTDPNNRYLFTSNADGSEAKALEPLGENGDLAHSTWSPGGTIVAYANIGDEQPEGGAQIHFIGSNRENIKALNVPGQGFLPNWSPAGKQILYSVWNQTSDNKPQIWISSGEPKTLGASRRNLKLNTWADKCAWAGENDVYCGVPQDLPANAGLGRDEMRTLPDDIYHVDLQTGTAVKINPPEQHHPVKNPVVSADQGKFFYTDESTGQLFSFDLK